MIKLSYPYRMEHFLSPGIWMLLAAIVSDQLPRISGDGAATRVEHERRFRQLRPAPTEINQKIFSSAVGAFYFWIRLENSDFRLIDQLIKHPKPNSTTDFGDFARLRLKLVGLRSEKFSGDCWNLLSSDPIRKFRSSNDQPTKHS